MTTDTPASEIVIETAESTELLQAIAQVQWEAKPLAKTKKNEHHKYEYAPIESYIEHVQSLIREHGLIVLFSNGSGAIETFEAGKMRVVRFQVQLTVVHVETGQRLSVFHWTEGADAADKGVWKAYTGARKYLLASVFNLTQGDDPERETPADKRRDRAPVKKVGDFSEPRPISERVVGVGPYSELMWGQFVYDDVNTEEMDRREKWLVNAASKHEDPTVRECAKRTLQAKIDQMGNDPQWEEGDDGNAESEF